MVAHVFVLPEDGDTPAADLQQSATLIVTGRDKNPVADEDRIGRVDSVWGGPGMLPENCAGLRVNRGQRPGGKKQHTPN